MSKHEYTREELIAICEQAIVPESKWWNRDSESAQRNVGQCWALLKAGCEFRVQNSKDALCQTDSRTIWVETYSEGFRSHEYAEDITERREYREKETWYLPTPERLKECEGYDWY